MKFMLFSRKIYNIYLCVCVCVCVCVCCYSQEGISKNMFVGWKKMNSEGDNQTECK